MKKNTNSKNTDNKNTDANNKSSSNETFNNKSYDSEVIYFETDDGDRVGFHVLGNTRLMGKDYILVVDNPEGDGVALILRDDSLPETEEAYYTPVEEDEELMAVAAVFSETLGFDFGVEGD